METKDLRRKLEQLKGAKKEVMNNITLEFEKVEGLKKSLKHHKQAKEIINQIGLKTQSQLQYNISSITTLALKGIFKDKDAYELKAEFVERRDKTECDLLFVKGENTFNPITSSGGGAIDVASFALRIVSWSMEFPHLQNVIILDEPMRFLSVDLQEKASRMIKELSDKLGLQFIIITHEQELTTYADKIFETKIKKGVTKVTEL